MKTEKQKGENSVHEKNRPGETDKSVQKEDRHDNNTRRNHDSLCYIDQIGSTCISPHPPIEPENIKYWYLAENHKRQDTGNLRNPPGYLPIETDQIGKKKSCHDKDDVNKENYPEIPPQGKSP